MKLKFDSVGLEQNFSWNKVQTVLPRVIRVVITVLEADCIIL